MDDYPVDGALVSSLVAQLYSAVGRDFDNTYSDVTKRIQDPADSLKITGSIMRVFLLDEYLPTDREQANLDGHQAGLSEYPDEVWGRGISFEYGREESRHAEAIPDEDEDDSLREKGQAIAAVAAYVDNTFTDAALEGAESLEIIKGGTRYTVEKLENSTRVVNQTTGAALTFSDDFENDLLIDESEGFSAQDYENLKALNKLNHERNSKSSQRRYYSPAKDLNLDL